MEKTIVTKDLENKTLIIERSFNAPKEKVWRAYSDKDMFEAWWGPEGWQTTTKQFEFAPGGTIHYGMKCNDEKQGEWFGKESWGMMKIETVEAPNRFTAQDVFSNPEGTVDETLPTQRFMVELIEENGVTKVINRSFVNSVEEMEQLIQMGMVQGFDSQLNRLEVLLQA